MPAWIKARIYTIGLIVIIAAAVAMSLRWVFLVPIYQSPDELLHLDYALCLYEHGGLFRANDASVPRQIMKAPRYRDFPFFYYLLHPYTHYLVARTEQGNICFNQSAQMPPGYGTKEFYQALDRDVPRGPFRIDAPPALAYYYPFGYYGLLSLWIGLIRTVSERITVLFFGARILSTVLLMATLLLSHATLRELGMRWLALLLTGLIGLFPLATFVGSYVQPDNLSLMLASLCFYLALVARRSPARLAPLAGLGVALGALFLTKQHYWLAIVLPVTAMLAVENLARAAGTKRWLATAVLAGLPSLCAAAFFYWTIWGLDYHPLRTTLDIHHAHGFAKIVLVAQGLRKAFLDFFATVTHDSFWGVFGWMDTPLIIRGLRTNTLVQFLIQICTWLVLGLTLIRIEQVSSRLWRLGRRDRGLLAVRLALSNPLLNSYFLFTIIMIVLYVRTDNFFGAQGRNWLPMILPIFLTGLVYAPRALTLPGSRRFMSAGLSAGLAAFVVLGTYYGPRSIEKRFYAPGNADPMRTMTIPGEPIMTNQITWKEGKGDGTGDDPYLIFKLDQPRYVYCVRLRFVLDNAQHLPGILQNWWMRSGRTTFTSDGCTSLFRIRPNPEEQVLTVWINQEIDLFRIDPDMRPCHFELKEMVAMTKLPARPAGGDGSVAAAER
jgi:4-amino-4-deoxy-L-arabinose transferase-like glycosyltransferase